MQRNARFWVWHNDDYVKLTLSPGESISTFQSESTEEG